MTPLAIVALLAQAAPAGAAFPLGDVLRTVAGAALIGLLGWMARLLVGLDRRFDRIETTLFGVKGDNGLYGDAAAAKKRLHALSGHVQGIALWVGVECEPDGRTSARDDDSPLERRVHERRVTPDRRQPRHA